MTPYIGRFAPSPTGPLHAGSLVSALASWADARHHNGQWLLRIEDIDPPREVAGASQEIIQCLDAHGLRWDGEVTFQSSCSAFYDQALQTLRNKCALYACQCTRKHLRSLATPNSTAYPGFCREQNLNEEGNTLRVAINNTNVQFIDHSAGPQHENVTDTTGDFIVRRRGPLYAYQLAVVVDDARQQVTHVVRGADLLNNTARQIALQQLLDYPSPEYLHLPLLNSSDGRKLSKQTGAQALDTSTTLDNLLIAWEFLGQLPISGCTSPTSFLKQALAQWQRGRIPKPQN